MLLAAGHEVVPVQQPRVVVVAHPAGLDVDDRLEVRQAVADLEDLVDLLLVLGDQHARAGVLQQVLDLGGRVRRVQAHRDGPAGDGAEVGVQPLGAVLGVDGHAVAGADPEGHQRVRGGLQVVPVVGPGDVLPEPEGLLAQGDLVGGVLRPLPHALDDGALGAGAGLGPGGRVECGAHGVPFWSATVACSSPR